MINFISNWAQGIIVAVILVTIIEMLLPKNNNKKYVQMVSGLFITFTIISPIISKFSSFDTFKESFFNYEKYFEIEDTYSDLTVNLEDINNVQTQKIYLSSLEADLKSRLKNKGYEVTSLNLDIVLEGEKFGLINSIALSLKRMENTDNDVKKVENVKIEDISIDTTTPKEEEVQKSDITGEEIAEIKNYLSLQYEVSIKNIYIN